MPIGAALAIAGGSIVSGLIGANAAENAANTQAGAAQQSAAMQKAMFDIQNQQQAPYREAGYSALNDIAGLKPYLTRQFTPEDFAAGIDPGYAFRLKMGQDQAMRQANLGGGTIGGNALAGLQDYTQGQASQEYGNAFNRFQTQRGNIYNTLAGIAGLGQTSLGQTGQMSTQTASNVGNAISNAGSAQAAGTVGAANAIGSGIQGAGNAYYLSNLLKPQATTNPSNLTYTPSGGNVGPVDYSLPSQSLTLKT